MYASVLQSTHIFHKHRDATLLLERRESNTVREDLGFGGRIILKQIVETYDGKLQTRIIRLVIWTSVSLLCILKLGFGLYKMQENLWILQKILALLRCLVCIVVSCLVCIVVIILCVFLSSYVYLLYYVCIAVFSLDAGLLARSQYSEGPATGHLDTGSSSFPCVCKQMLRWFARFQVASTCFSCSPPDLNLFCLHAK